MIVPESTFRPWHFALIGAWWLGSAVAAAAVLNADLALWLRIAASLACWAAALAAPGLVMRRASHLDERQARVLVANLMAGGFWALSFGVAMAGYHAIIEDDGGLSGALGSLLFLAPPSAVAYAAGVIALTERFGRSDLARE